MTLFVFAAAAGFSLAGVLTDNSAMLEVGLGLWVLCVLTAIWTWFRSRRRDFRTPEAARAAAEAGDPRGLLALALIAKDAGDHNEAERLLLLAIDRGDVDSMWELACLVEGRDGIDAAEPWYRMAADNNHVAARRLLRRRDHVNGESPS
jgi:hypothetical protein